VSGAAFPADPWPGHPAMMPRNPNTTTNDVPGPVAGRSGTGFEPRSWNRAQLQLGQAWSNRTGLLRELLGQPDDDALGAADVGEPIRVLVLHHFTDQFGAVGKQARDHVIDVIDGEHDAADS
jgi:hypothetical protein